MWIPFGFTLLVGVLCAYVAVREDVRRRHLPLNAARTVLWTAFVGLLGARVYRLLNAVTGSQARAGLAWFAGLLAAIMTLAWLARRASVPVMIMLDVAAPALMIGYAAGRMAWFLISGGGSGRVALLRPDGLMASRFPVTDVYAAILGGLIFWFLWQEGWRAMQHQRPHGIVTAEYFILSGGMLFLLGLAGTGPHMWLRGSQSANLVSMLVGVGALAVVLPGYYRVREEHRILDHIAQFGEATQPEYTPASPECPHPERWKMYDSMTAEVEVLDFLKCLVTTVKPNLIVETGTFSGVSTIAMAEALRQNGFGKIITCELDPKVFAKAKDRIDASGLGSWVEYRNESSLEMVVHGKIDIFFSDSDTTIREKEVRHFLPQISRNGLVLMHDAGSHYKVVREGALRMEAEGLISVVLLRTPRGLVVAQKRAERI